MTPTQAIAVLRSIPTHDAMQAEALEMAVAGMRDTARLDAVEKWGELRAYRANTGRWWAANAWHRGDLGGTARAALDNLRAAVEAGK